jgi:hypothetical protein
MLLGPLPGNLSPDTDPPAEYLGIKAPRALDVIGDDEVAHHHSPYELRGFGH